MTAPARLGPGAFVAVVGPSGAGKDTLIAHARATLAGEPRCVFPRRIVTRVADAALEDHDTVSEAEFARACGAGRYALWWNAHGLGYAIPAEADRAVADGAVVVCNVSRAAVPGALERYARVVVVLVTAPPDILAERLAARGRESREEIERRLARARYQLPVAPHTVVIDNVAAPDVGAGRIVEVVGQLVAPATAGSA